MAWLYIFLEFIYLKCSIVSIYEDVNISLLSLGIAIQVRTGGTLWHGPQQDQVKDNRVRNVEKWRTTLSETCEEEENCT
jgi:hypothetical protein